ncbi:chitin deacetylase [Cladochytrium tenue]|nr:chitin deacetylase [Cladochytrium tenue]
MKILTTLAATAALLAASGSPTFAYDFSWAPTQDQVAPTNAAWTAAFLGSSSASGYRVPLADVLAGVAPLGNGTSAASRGGGVVDRAAARVYTGGLWQRGDALWKRRPQKLARRDGDAGFAGNDVSEAGSYTDWAWCDSSLPSSAWGLSYDDGPSEYTPGVLSYLAEKDVSATFFIVGSRVLENPDALLSAYQSGHQIGMHTWSHPDLTQLSDDQIVAEIVYSAMAIKTVTGIVPKYMRPPYGSINDNVRSVLKAMGVRVVMWATDSTDSADGATAASIADVVSQWGGSDYDRAISLEHDLQDVEAAAIAPTLDSLLSFGRSPRPVADCIGYGMGDAYAASPLQQFFDEGYFDGDVHPPTSASSTIASSTSSSSTIASSTSSSSTIASSTIDSSTIDSSTVDSSTIASSTDSSSTASSSSAPESLSSSSLSSSQGGSTESSSSTASSSSAKSTSASSTSASPILYSGAAPSHSLSHLTVLVASVALLVLNVL